MADNENIERSEVEPAADIQAAAEAAGYTGSNPRDLDETRRLLYMMLVVKRTKRYNLVGTLANAILHHQQVDVDRESLLDDLVCYVENDDDCGNDHEAWLRGQIDRIGAELGD